jgi:hypothetical protein
MADMLQDLLRTETRAARLEARLELDADVAGLWRMESALVEAVRSVALEDVSLREADLLLRLTENRLSDQDAQAVTAAAAQLRLLRAPGDPVTDPVGAIRRIEARLGPPEPMEGVETWREPEMLEEAEIRECIAPLLAAPVTPVVTALRVAAEYGLRTGRTAPMAERALFASVEGALRGRARGGAAARSEAELEPGDFAAIEAGWVVLPATALQRDGYRAWSPARADGVSDFLRLAARSLDIEIGRWAEIRRWVEEARRLGEGVRRNSSRTGMIRLLLDRPLVTSGVVMDELGLTRRGALDMIGFFEARGLIRCVTPRSQARFWATRTLAERIGASPARRRGGPVPRLTGAAPLSEDASTPARSTPGPMDRSASAAASRREEAREGMERAFSELDRLMGEADAILSARGGRRACSEESD